MIAQNLIFENKIIDARLFKKVIEVYSISGFQKEAGLFFEHYKLDINSEVRAQYLCYSNALIDFYNKKFSTETISKLQEQKQLKHNPQLYLSIKSLLLKFHFEKENFDDYDSMIDTTIRYLDRKNNDLHMSTIEDFKNFLNILKFISSNSLKNKKFKEELNKKIKNPLSMLDKKWILEKYIL